MPPTPPACPYLLPDVDLAEALEEVDERHVQSLAAALTVALAVVALVHDTQQTKHTRNKVAVDALLGRVTGERAMVYMWQRELSARRARRSNTQAQSTRATHSQAMLVA